MKKLLLAALLLLTAASAEARQVTTDLLVVKVKSNKVAGAVHGVYDAEQTTWIHENVKAILNEWKVDHVVVDIGSFAAAERPMMQLRVGRVIVGPDTITARAVLHERFARRGATFDYPVYRPESLFMARSVQVLGTATTTPMLPSVPHLFILEPQNANQDIATSWQRATTCSIGVSSVSDFIGAGTGTPHECEACTYSPYTANVFMPANSMQAVQLDRATVGGVLPLTSVYMNAVPKQMQELGRMVGDLFFTRVGADGDTTGLFESAPEPRRWDDPDTAQVFKRLNIGWNVLNASNTATAAAQMVMTVGPVGLGSLGGVPPRKEMDYQSIFIALAALDSLLGGDLLNNVKTQAVTIDGAFARVSAQNSFGVYLPDSAAVKASVDSLVAYGIPFVVGANVDSVEAYAYEKAWWNKGQVKFSPQVWSGVNGANGAASYVAGKYTLRDIFGHARARQAYGPANGLAADTTAYAQFVYAFARNDSLFPGRTSRFLLPPLDDYVPTNTVMGDSVLVAARLAGATGVRIAGADTLRRSHQTTNVQGDYFGGLKLRAHTGEYVTGGTRIMSVPGGTYAGTIFVSDSGYAYHPFCLINDRQFSALVRGKWNGYEGATTDPAYGQTQFETIGSSVNRNVSGNAIGAGGPDPNRYHNEWAMAGRASILKVGASTLGGTTRIANQRQPSGADMRPGWWTIRSADGFAKVVNAVAGRTLIRWGYPDQIEP